MTNLFNRNDGTFAAVQVTDLGGNFITVHAVLLSETSGAFGYAAPGTAGTVLTSNGTTSDPTFQASSSISFSTTHAVLLSENTTSFGYVGSNTSGWLLTAQGAGSDPIFNQGVAGLATGGSATSGNIGEIVTNSNTGATLTTGNGTANITSITISAGIWLIFGYAVANITGTGTTGFNCGQSTGSSGYTGFSATSLNMNAAPLNSTRLPIVTQPTTVASSTTIFLNAGCTRASGSGTVDGAIWGLRVG